MGIDHRAPVLMFELRTSGLDHMVKTKRDCGEFETMGMAVLFYR